MMLQFESINCIKMLPGKFNVSFVKQLAVYSLYFVFYE